MGGLRLEGANAHPRPKWGKYNVFSRHRAYRYSERTFHRLLLVVITLMHSGYFDSFEENHE